MNGLCQRMAAEVFSKNQNYLKSIHKINWTTVAQEAGKAFKNGRTD